MTHDRVRRRLIEVGVAIFLGIGLGLLFTIASNPDVLGRLFAPPARAPAGTTQPPPVGTTAAATPSGSLLTPTPISTAALPQVTPTPTTPVPVASPTSAASDSAQPTSAAPARMGLIPAGFFQMGSSDETYFEAPEHPVLLDAYYLDLFEVTNAQYGACISAGVCTQGRRRNSFTRSGYGDDPTYADYPMIAVTWDQAEAYCAWAGKRLPTEAEWEYAASGPDNQRWPWGDTFDVTLSAASARDTQPVGSYPLGASPYGVFDMAGNVREWVADAYNADFYASSPPRDPLAETGNRRIYRGGSFANPDPALYTTSRRVVNVRGYYDLDLGFRCAQDVTPASLREAPAGLVAEFCRVFLAYKPEGPCP